MDGRGDVQILKMPVPGKSNKVASNVTLHISFPHDPKRSTHAPVTTPENGKSSRLPALRHNTKVVSLTSSSTKFQRGSEQTTSPFRDLCVGLPKINDANRVSADGNKRRLPIRAKNFLPTSRSLAPDEQPKVFNPEPVAYHPQLFNDALNKVRVDGMTLSTKSESSEARPDSAKRKHPSTNRSSNVIHKTDVPPRHGGMWSGSDSPLCSKNYILHSDRHQWDEIFNSLSKLSEGERLAMEFEYLNRLKSLKKRREVIPHRESMDFIMGGHKVELSERENADVYQELKRLKSMVLPAVARDLYVGRGFKLPKKHALNKPRALENFDGGNKAKMAADSGKSPDGASVRPGVSSAVNRVGNTPGDTNAKKESHSPDEMRIEESYLNNLMKQGTDAGADGGESKTTLPTPDKQPTPKLSQGINIQTVLGNSEIEAIKNTFKTLTRTDDGKVEFDQIKSHLPGELNPAQEQYVKKIHEMICSTGEFKEEDFLFLCGLSKKISKLSGSSLEAFSALDEAKLEVTIAKFGGLFDDVDRQQTGKITMSSLQEILHSALEADEVVSLLETITPVVDPEKEGSISKLDYLAFVPYFLSLVP